MQAIAFPPPAAGRDDELQLVANDFDGIIGESAALQLALTRLCQVAPTSSSVLLLGETGTGKELFARALHDRSRRRTRALVRVNCAALPPTLAESELFGHERGAFTGAVSMRQGRFELADGGSIFLDEIGDLSPDIQPSCCACSRRENSSASAPPGRSAWTSASSRLRTGTWMPTWPADSFARTSTIA